MKTFKYKITGLAICLLLLVPSVKAVELNSKNRDSNYVGTIVTRSQKIVDKLKLSDVTVSKNVLYIIANRYFELNDIYAKRDTSVNRIKRSTLKGEAKNTALNAAQNEKEAALYRSHFAFTADLSLYLNESQIEVIKDGITFGVVKVTYDAYVKMIPTLRQEEKTQILAWLKEGREFALDAESSEKKHAAFGKYKGRINNYLSKQGHGSKNEKIQEEGKKK